MEYDVERKMMWVGMISLLAFIFIIGKLLVGLISGGFSHALNSIGSSNIDYVMIGAAIPYIIVSTIQAIHEIRNESIDSQDNDQSE